MKRIKKHSNGNEYALTDHGIWVRNFVKKGRAIDINHFTSKTDYNLIVENEVINNSIDLSNIDAEVIEMRNVVIVSDGFNFSKYEPLLAKFPSSVGVMGTNRSLAKWTGVRKMDYFVVNNPYSEALTQLPRHRYYPKCIVSSRTNPQFVKYYKRFNMVYKYSPSVEEDFSPAQHKPLYYIDDYRNSICAAIGLAYQFGAEKILLFCCDDSFEEERPGSEKLDNGLYMYPQQWMSHELIEANLLWLRTQELIKVEIGNFSHGPNLTSIPTLTEKNVGEFF